MNKQRKATKKLFCQIYDHARKLRRVDPTQFEVIYDDWKRLRTGKI